MPATQPSRNAVHRGAIVVAALAAGVLGGCNPVKALWCRHQIKVHMLRPARSGPARPGELALGHGAFGQNQILGMGELEVVGVALYHLDRYAQALDQLGVVRAQVCL